MRWTPGTRTDDVVDRRRGRAGWIAAAAAVVGVVAVWLFGVNVSPPARDPDSELVAFVTFVTADVQDTFAGMCPPYRRAKLILFTTAIDTGCGRSSSAVGPFYCPADEHAYIDLSFYRELRERFGAPGDFAQAYVIAHELGHHVQKLRGQRRDSIAQELQADCLAGAWAGDAQRRNLLEVGDVDEALNAAAQVGDDRLQVRAGLEVKPETFTHGSSEQRVRWFRRGLDGGTPACDSMREAL